jgi:hypothetical protein
VVAVAEVFGRYLFDSLGSRYAKATGKQRLQDEQGQY